MTADDFRLLMERGDVDGIRGALESEPTLANRTVRWFLNQENETDPLHYVSDCVHNGWLTNGREGEIAGLLLAHGAAVDGTGNRETPLIGAASQGAPKVARVLIEAGASLEKTSVFGSRALHWAAWMGLASTVQLLIARGAEIDPKCSEFGATPLYWAVHGYGPDGPKQKADQVGAARLLIEAGAVVKTANKHGLAAIELAKRGAGPEMHELLRSKGA